MNKKMEKPNKTLESVKKYQTHLLEMENILHEFQSILDEFDRTEQSKVSEFEDRSTEIISTEIYKGEVIKEKEQGL